MRRLLLEQQRELLVGDVTKVNKDLSEPSNRHDTPIAIDRDQKLRVDTPTPSAARTPEIDELRG
jgi:hypothetical protein